MLEGILQQIATGKARGLNPIAVLIDEQRHDTLVLAVQSLMPDSAFKARYTPSGMLRGFELAGLPVLVDDRFRDPVVAFVPETSDA